jgi:hypothetical protein
MILPPLVFPGEMDASFLFISRLNSINHQLSTVSTVFAEMVKIV